MSDTYSQSAGSHSQPDRPVGKARSTGLTILLVFVTFGIWSLLWVFWSGEDLKRYRRDGLGGAVHLILWIFISPVVMFLMADEVAKLYQDAGEEPPITAIWGLWFLLPLIGNIIWYVRMQSSLNNFWIAGGAPAASGV
jgi:hypothetical protein